MARLLTNTRCDANQETLKAMTLSSLRAVAEAPPFNALRHAHRVAVLGHRHLHPAFVVLRTVIGCGADHLHFLRAGATHLPAHAVTVMRDIRDLARRLAVHRRQRNVAVWLFQRRWRDTVTDDLWGHRHAVHLHDHGQFPQSRGDGRIAAPGQERRCQ